jgi:hypothetical protein
MRGRRAVPDAGFTSAPDRNPLSSDGHHHIEQTMRIPTVSVRQWKTALCLGVLFFGLLCGLALANWQRVLVPGVAGTLGVNTDDAPDGWVPGSAVEAGSPLKALGVKAGDRLHFDDPADLWRNVFAVGEPIGMVIDDGRARRHVTVTTVPIRRIDPSLGGFYVLVLGNSILAVALAALIGLRRAMSTAARILAVILLVESAWSLDYMTYPALVMFRMHFMQSFLGLANFCCIYLFSCLFPADDSGHVRRWVRRAGLFGIAVKLACFALAMLALATPLKPPTLVDGVNEAADYLLAVLACINLLQAFRQSSATARQRVLWVGAATFIKFILFALMAQPFLAFARTLDFYWVQMAVTALANIAMAYGILRHRVLDVGFAINRALVYAIVSATMLVSFGLLEWLAHHFVSGGGEDSEKSMVLDAAIALGLYLGFHRLKHSVDHWVEKVFFHHWHENEARLRRFVRQAMHITSAADLEAAYLAALQRFTHDAGAVLYRRRGEGYEQSGAALMGAPHVVGINDALAVALRTEHAPVLLADSDSALPGELALPMSFRGELQGFALVGLTPNRGAYRSDEIAALEHATQQVGLDLHALQTEQLQAELAGLRRELAALQGAFERYAGGRVA